MSALKSISECNWKSFISVLERTHYVIVYCSGYIKSWLTSVLARPADDDELSDADTTVSCLVALAVPVEMSVTAESDNGDGGIEVDVASSSSDPSSPVGALVSTTFEFFSRHTADGKFTFVDHRPAPSLIDGVLYSA